jgi:hypothetical protein
MGYIRHFGFSIQNGNGPTANKQPDAHPVHHTRWAGLAIPMVSWNETFIFKPAFCDQALVL